MRTPTPYHVRQGERYSPVFGTTELLPKTFNVVTSGVKSVKVCECGDASLSKDENRENAEWIALACNLHDDFGSICEEFVSAVEKGDGPPSETYGQMKVVLAKEKARGGE